MANQRIGQLEIGDTVTVKFTPSQSEEHQVISLLIGTQKQGKKKEK